MKIQRFIGNFAWDNDQVSTEDDHLLHQLHSVLKCKVGQQFMLSDGKEKEALVTLSLLTKKEAAFNINTLQTRAEGFSHNVHLFVSILKRDNFEWIAQKAVECGVTSITPLLCDRTIKTKISEERLTKIMHEATEQSDRIKLSTLHPTTSFNEAITTLIKSKIPFYIADKEGVSTPALTTKEVALLIGPEGGFTPEEKKYAEAHGGHTLSLGETTLRAETAAIVGTFLLTKL
jgi:16S rRNA (uracil1498-N3)-methyltransferase